MPSWKDVSGAFDSFFGTSRDKVYFEDDGAKEIDFTVKDGKTKLTLETSMLEGTKATFKSGAYSFDFETNTKQSFAYKGTKLAGLKADFKISRTGNKADSEKFEVKLTKNAGKFGGDFKAVANKKFDIDATTTFGYQAADGITVGGTIGFNSKGALLTDKEGRSKDEFGLLFAKGENTFGVKALNKGTEFEVSALRDINSDLTASFRANYDRNETDDAFGFLVGGRYKIDDKSSFQFDVDGGLNTRTRYNYQFSPRFGFFTTASFPLTNPFEAPTTGFKLQFE